VLEGLSSREFATRGCARSAENAKPIANAEEPVQVTSFVHLYGVKNYLVPPKALEDFEFLLAGRGSGHWKTGPSQAHYL